MRNRSSTRRAQLIEAARLELESSGFANFNLERVAERADCNKNVVYRHLHSREEAILTAWASLLQDRIAIQTAQPTDLADGLRHWLTSNSSQEAFFKLLAEEARNIPAPILAEDRTTYYQNQIESLNETISSPNPTMTFMALLSMVTLPFVLPQVFTLVTQKPINQESLNDYLSSILDLLNARK